MTARDEGVIKFNCQWQKTAPLTTPELSELIPYRNKLFKLGLIGVYPDGIGFGNLSQRFIRAKSQFVISGSQTGHIAEAQAEHFALILNYSIIQNEIACSGPIQASSESLTHAMIYEIFPDINAVVHIHSTVLWNKLKHTVPTTREEIPYGTPQMAQEIERLEKETHLSSHGILVMAGHEEGIISFGKNLADAYKILSSYLTI